MEGNNWAPNGSWFRLATYHISLTFIVVIPDYSKLTYLVRAPSIGEVNDLVKRVRACFE